MSIAISGSTITFADLTTQTTALASAVGFRNRIINGDMRIDQRNAGASLSFPANTAGYCVDRFKFSISGSAAATVQRSTTVPTGQGFTNSLLTTITTAEPAVASGNKVAGYYYILEGFNVSDLGWGTASAQSITISFWVRSSVTGTFSFSVMNTSFTRSYNSSYAISVANTWEKKTFTITGDTGATSIDTTNGSAIQLVFDLGFSTVYETSTANSWLATGAYALSGCTKLSSTVGATFYLTGVQLEAGSTATDFERRPIGTELQLCQRYFFKTGNTVSGSILGVGYVDASVRANCQSSVPVPMRTSPTLNTSGTASDYAIRWAGSSLTTCNALPTITTAVGQYYRIDCFGPALIVGYGSFLIPNTTAGSLGYDAEL